ncbi:hypothetical protein IWX90DRAFT_437414 [Phyllosticta citrichinensis]|uniref:Secreted protein n=1 Tax=Phyllosticta citrichinensis TaxID=1130410 RepID=A0ABR1XMA0_9PEZI
MGPQSIRQVKHARTHGSLAMLSLISLAALPSLVACRRCAGLAAPCLDSTRLDLTAACPVALSTVCLRLVVVVVVVVFSPLSLPSVSRLHISTSFHPSTVLRSHSNSQRLLCRSPAHHLETAWFHSVLALPCR